MYGLPGSRIQFGTRPARRKPGRPSALAKYLQKQRDLFPVDLLFASLSADAVTPTNPIGGRPQRSEDGPQSEGGGLYVLVTRKGSLKNETNRYRNGKAGAKNGTSRIIGR